MGEVTNGDVFGYDDCDDDVRMMFYSVLDGGHTWYKQLDSPLNQVGLNATDVVGAFFQGATVEEMPEQADFEFDPDNLPRAYLVHAPVDYTGDEALPLVFVLHGRPDTGNGIAVITEMHQFADSENFIAVFPHGINRQWNYTRGVAEFRSGPIDDVQYLLNLVEHLSQDFNIDRNRLYVTGFSNGGFMTQRVACEAPEHFAAFAVVGAGFLPSWRTFCDGGHVTPIMFMHGTDDISIPWGGIEDQGFVTSASVENTIEYWVWHHNCELNSDMEELPAEDPEFTRVVKFTFPNCADGSAIDLWAIAEGGHNWPGVPGVIGEQIAGKVNTDIHASEVIWDFFSQYSLEDEVDE